MLILIGHGISFLLGFCMDLLWGDPYWLPHPVRLMGKAIALGEKRLMPPKKREALPKQAKLWRGRLLVAVMVIGTGLITLALLLSAYRIHWWLGITAESVMTYQILAVKCLRVESMKVYAALMENDLPKARRAVAGIVGRDTDVLDAVGVTKAAVETVAENCADGVIAPMLYLAIGGPVLGMMYKMVNTMDSMVGYQNTVYLHFGRAAARLDDIVNYLPARISGLLLILAAFLPGREMQAKRAWRIFLRDRYQHASPNSAQSEAACAGALGIQLAGDAVYFGKRVEKPVIGDALREVEYEDIVRANQLLYRAAFLGEGFCLAGMLMFLWLL